MSRDGKGADGGWYEEYRCGCVSDTVRRKRELLGYCGKHGDERTARSPHRDLSTRETRIITEIFKDAISTPTKARSKSRSNL